jgi:nicotinate-nucleotide adenylyltransferase
METAERIALFGGSFDPPHLAHTGIASAAVAQCRLDRVIFLPCRESPLKGRLPGASAEHRTAMLRLAAAEYPWAEVDEWELSRPGPSYSWQTVEHFCESRPGAVLHWLMGEDQWAALERWARPEFLRTALTFIVFARNGQAPQSRAGWRAHFLQGEFPGSSTAARTALAGEKPVEQLLAPAVAEYARRHQLYRRSAAGGGHP